MREIHIGKFVGELTKKDASFAWKSMGILQFREHRGMTCTQTIECTERTVLYFWTGYFASYSQEHFNGLT